MAIPLYNMSVNDPSTQGEIEGTQELTKRRFVTFRGTVVGGGATELFLDGTTNYRLKVHDTSVMDVLWHGVALGTTAALSSASNGNVSITNFAGVTALAGAAVVATSRGALDTYAFTANDTADALVLTVTNATAVTKYYEVSCWVVEHSVDTGYPV